MHGNTIEIRVQPPQSVDLFQNREAARQLLQRAKGLEYEASLLREKAKKIEQESADAIAAAAQTSATERIEQFFAEDR